MVPVQAVRSILVVVVAAVRAAAAAAAAATVENYLEKEKLARMLATKVRQKVLERHLRSRSLFARTTIIFGEVRTCTP